MTGEQFGYELLRAIQENSNKSNGIERPLLKPLESVVRKALGLKEVDVQSPPPIIQQAAPVTGNSAIFPHWRVKYDSSGIEIGRRRVNSMEEWAELHRTEPGFNYVEAFQEKE